MNLKELEYIVRISEEKNVTHAAAKLYITPSALNQQLLRLERELGAQLFYRNRTGWVPTKAGEIYLKSAREILRIKQETYHRLQDVVEVQRGTLSIGLTPRRSARTFVNIYPAFHKAYPEIKLNLHEANVRKQQKMIANGEIDIGFMSLEDGQRTDDNYRQIYSEEVMLYVSSEHELLKHAGKTKGGEPIIDLAQFKDESFALIYPESTLRETVDRLFLNAGFTPNVLFESIYLETIMGMVRAGVCCTISSVNPHQAPPEGVTICHFPEKPRVSLEVCTRKGSHLSKPGSYFIELVIDFWLKNAGLRDASAPVPTVS